MAAASKGELENLHSALATALAAAIDEKEMKVIEVPEGTKLVDGTVAGDGGQKIVVMVRNAAILNVARQLLKDNDITALPVPGKPLANLTAKLPYAGSEDDAAFEPAVRGKTH